MAESKYGPGVYHLHGAAMAAPFEIIIAGETEPYAAQAAQAAFEEIDRLEGLLSSFINGSDISRINAQGALEPALVSIETMACLKIAAQVHADTGGAFDITARRPSAKAGAKSPIIGMKYVLLDEKNFTVRLEREGVRLDLGGIGKGYGIDKALELLQDWGVKNALLSAGDSTILAAGAPPGRGGWPISIGGDQPDKRKPIERELRNRALSGSGTRVRGKHIIDPATGKAAAGPLRTWASCRSATVADALSTAFMVMTPEATQRYCKTNPGTWAVLLRRERDPFVKIGAGF